MSLRLKIALECAALAVLGLLLLNAACQPERDHVFNGTPTFGAFPQIFAVSVDDDSDGTPESTDEGETVAGPGELGRAAASGEARVELFNDNDSIGVTCSHKHGGGALGRTECTGSFFGTFSTARLGSRADFELALVETVSASPAPTATSASVDFVLSCGAPAIPVTISTNDAQRNVRVDAAVITPTTCSVEIHVTSMLAEGTGSSVIHAASITAVVVDPTRCLTHDACPQGKVCGPSGSCQTGETTDACFHTQTHCNENHPFCVDGLCTAGAPGNPCRHDGECSSGNPCEGGLCVGQLCNDDSECTDPLANICTHAGCSPSGNRSDPCISGQDCRLELICVSNTCTMIAGVGEACDAPDTRCDGTAFCDDVTHTCQASKEVGEDCNANIECTPPFLSCIGGTCANRSDQGGACDPDDTADCISPLVCVAETCQ
jgi:hypothetical protein